MDDHHFGYKQNFLKKNTDWDFLILRSYPKTSTIVGVWFLIQPRHGLEASCDSVRDEPLNWVDVSFHNVNLSSNG
jgi:hypothetical protein